MRVRLLSQIAGRDTVAAQLNDFLRRPGYDRLRFLIAYARWSGLHLVDENLQRFSARGAVDGIVGIDFGGTTPEALSYLKELPNSRIRIFESGDPAVGFHPKVFLFTGSSGWAAILGSANASTGGLFNNVEICAVATGNPREANPYEEVWRQFSDPLPPINPDNLVLVDDAVLAELAPKLDHYTKRAPDRPKRFRFRRPTPVQRAEVPPVPMRPPAPTQGRRRRTGGRPVTTTRRPPTTGPNTLYVELWDETGGGTQVQFPKRAVTDYFGADLSSITWLTLRTPTGPAKVRIQVFPNNTYRIPLAFTEAVPRKAILRFDRTGVDQYRVRAVPHTHPSYRTWLRRCTEQTRSDSKRWGVA
jgi:HKD family nuclease